LDDVFDYLCAIMSKYWVYMMQSANGRALYTGVTNDIVRRVGEHKEGRGSVFTARYKCHKLVYFEEFGLIEQAIVREKEIKNMTRAGKEELIDTINPDRRDLFEQ
jgi:putative endonuclease